MRTLALLLLSTIPALAQNSFQFGPRVGATLATVRYSGSNAFGQSATHSPTYQIGFEVGVVSAWQLGHFAIQPALLFQRKGFSSDYEALYASISSPSGSVSRKVTMNYLTLPVNFVYAQRVNGQGFQLFAGPYLSALVGGHYHTTFINYPSNDRLELEGRVVAGAAAPNTPGNNNSYYKRLDVGLETGLGYRYQQWLLRASYSWGLRNLAATYPGPPDATNPNGTTLTALPTHTRSVQLSLTHLFHTH